MKKTRAASVVLLGICLWAAAAYAQDTNLSWLGPQTKLEGFDTNTGSVVLRATGPLGSVAANAGALSIKCRESSDLGSGRREYGVVLGIAESNQAEDVALIDYEELAPLLNAMDYMSRVDWSSVPLPSFDAVFTTKGGFRVVAFGSRRTGTVEYAVRNIRLSRVPLLLSRDQLSQVRNLLEQARTKLEELRTQRG